MKDSVTVEINVERECGGNDYLGSPLVTANVFRNVPIPSITTSTTEPGRRVFTPMEVPQAITSPGINVISPESWLTIRAGDKIMSVAG